MITSEINYPQIDQAHTYHKSQHKRSRSRKGRTLPITTVLELPRQRCRHAMPNQKKYQLAPTIPRTKVFRHSKIYMAQTKTFLVYIGLLSPME